MRTMAALLCCVVPSPVEAQASPVDLRAPANAPEAPSLLSPRMTQPPDHNPRVFDWKLKWQLLDAAPFSARVASDGSVGFDEHHLTDAKAEVGTSLPARYFGAFDPTGAIDRVPTEAPIFRISFKFDLTDEIMRARGEDPYRAEKQKFLARTFDARFAMATAERRRRLWRALAELPDELEFLWGDPSRPASIKRAEITKLWCEADSEERGREGLAAGVEARAIIERFLQVRRIAERSPILADCVAGGGTLSRSRH